MAETQDQKTIHSPKPSAAIDLKRLSFIFLGIITFLFVYLMDPLPDAVDPQGQRFQLTREGKAAIALFLLAGIWWVFEVIPIGVTGISGKKPAEIAIAVAAEVLRVHEKSLARADSLPDNVHPIGS